MRLEVEGGNCGSVMALRYEAEDWRVLYFDALINHFQIRC